MISDDRLKALYRASTSRAPDAVSDADIEQVLGRAGWPDEENTPLDRIADSALHADVLRMVMELGPEAEALSREVAALRKPQAVPARRPAARGWMALAAGMGAAALLIAGLGQLPGPEQETLPGGSDVILSASFDEADAGSQPSPAPQAPQAIFQGDFDS